jgi:hypothetical protein
MMAGIAVGLNPITAMAYIGFSAFQAGLDFYKVIKYAKGREQGCTLSRRSRVSRIKDSRSFVSIRG